MKRCKKEQKTDRKNRQQQDGIYKPNYINNHIKYKLLHRPIKRQRLSDWINQKKKEPKKNKKLT